MKKILVILMVAVAVLTGFLYFSSLTETQQVPDDVAEAAESDETQASRQLEGAPRGIVGNRDAEPGDGMEDDVEEEAKQSESEEREDVEGKAVDEFDAVTDRWMSAEDTKPPTMKEIEAYHAKFKTVPNSRKEECLQRALNLIPDENVMLLAGILMDKTMDKELVEMVFNDILNRDEDVKKPIMKQIFKDKTHPCWADVAWILDVTGEKQ